MCMGVVMENIMETWYLILISLCISFLFKAILTLLFPSKPKPTGKLPPGPITLPIIGSFLWLYKSFADLEPLLHNLHQKYGAIVTLHIGTHTAIFIRSRSLAHQALIQNGAVFSDRPPALLADKIITTNLRNISCASYGPTWRLFRRNLTSGILHPARVKSYSRARKWVLDILINSLQLQSKVRVKDHLQYSMFCLLALMCFGDRLDENKIKEIEAVQRRLLLGTGRFSVLNLWPSWLAKILFRKRWEELLQIYKHQEAVLVPLINVRKKTKPMCNGKEDDHDGEEAVISYVDTLLELQLPDEKRKLDDVELVILCSEFLSAGTDTTSTALEWIMANLVKHPHIQERLLTEIKGVVVDGEEEVKEEDLQTMPYLKAVVFEGLRRHPPGHFVLPHAVTEDVVLDGCLVPKNGSVNFMVAEMGWDPKVWEDPMAFKPERFLKEDQSDGEDHIIDITGTKKIKMMPFGVGRRICPAYALAMLHLEYFVANLVLKFEWTAADQVDLTEKQEFTVVMKNPLQALISPRLNKY